MANKLFKALPKLKNPNASTKPIKLKALGGSKVPKINFPKLSSIKRTVKDGTKNDFLRKMMGKFTKFKVK
jgi:hypothetical protein